MLQIIHIPWILRINLFKPTNPKDELAYISSWYIWFVTEINIGYFRRGPQNHGITSRSWNNIKIFMLDHGL